MSTGPKSSLGSVKRVSRYSKYRLSMARAKVRTRALLAVPGGPTRAMCSPASTDRTISRIVS